MLPQENARAHAQALSRLVEQHDRALHSFLMTHLRDQQEAREVAQEAYVRLLQLDEPGGVSFLRAYLFKTAKNLALNRLRQRVVRGRLDELGSGDEHVELRSPERWLLGREAMHVLKRALFELSPKCRRAFVLHRFLEWDVERIARHQGISPRTVRHYLMHAGIYCKLRIQGFSAVDAHRRVRQ